MIKNEIKIIFKIKKIQKILEKSERQIKENHNIGIEKLELFKKNLELIEKLININNDIVENNWNENIREIFSNIEEFENNSRNFTNNIVKYILEHLEE